MEPSSLDRQVDVLIGGAGVAGLSLAIALRQSLGSSFSVAVADPALGRATEDARASAIVAAARRLFEAIGVWDRIEAQPILEMVVTDSRLQDSVRPSFLRFDGEVEPGEPFAHMVENGPLLSAMVERANEEGVAFLRHAVADLRSERGHRGRGSASQLPTFIEARLSNGDTVSARLLVAADGARSVIRERAGIAGHGWTYSQSAIVATVAHEREHGARAEEHFLPAGPFAILPLKSDPSVGHRSSIVWTEDAQEAARVVALPGPEFHCELERRFGLRLGEIRVVGPVRVHPLGLSVARRFVADRVALVGDAAHVIHPIAGQGLNMGLKDVAALAEVVVDAARLGLDPGSLAVLERYQRWRRFDTVAMGVATDGLNRLFSNQSDLLRLLRDTGLGLVDRMPGLKRFFIREAAGLIGEVPKLLKGEAL